MRVLSMSELLEVSGGRRLSQAETDRMRACVNNVERGMQFGTGVGASIGLLSGGWTAVATSFTGTLVGQAMGVKTKPCKDQARITRQRDEIERRRHSEL